MISSSAAAIASNLSASSRKPEMADARMLGNRQQRVADRARATACPPDPAGSARRSRTAPCSPCSRRCGRRRPRTGRGCCTSAGSAPAADCAGTSDPTPTTTPGTSSLPDDRLNHRALFGRVVHERADAAEHRLEDRQPDRRVALGGRHQDRARRRGAHAVVRVVVAVAEEEAVVVVAGVLRRCSRRAPGSSVPRRRASRARRRASAAARRRDPIARRTTSGSRSCFTRKRRTGTPLTCSTPARQLVAPRDVVGRARRQDLDLGVTREMLGDVARVQLGAAVDRRGRSAGRRPRASLLVIVGFGAPASRRRSIVSAMQVRRLVMRGVAGPHRPSSVALADGPSSVSAGRALAPVVRTRSSSPCGLSDHRGAPSAPPRRPRRRRRRRLR